MRRLLAVVMVAGLAMLADVASAQTRSPRPGWPSNPALDAPFDRKDYAEVRRLALPLANKGDGYAQHLVGLLYQHGLGVPQNASTAVGWYRKAAANGVVAAQTNLAAALAGGTGVAQDYKEAAMWFQKASDGGALEASYNLAGLYYRGLGVKQDYRKAADLYRGVADQAFKR